MQAAQWKLLGARVALPVTFVAMLEVLSYASIAISNPFLDEEIRRTGAIYTEQTARTERLLTNLSHGRELLDPDLGWRYRTAYVSKQDTINRQGLRASHEYTALPSQGMTRVAAFGDSFVYGNEVGNDAAWSAQVEKKFPEFEVLNYGVGGYGTDQAYLRYLKEGNELAPDVVLVGFTPIDLGRVVNVYRRFMTTAEWPLFKPRFVLSANEELRLLPSPVRDSVAYARYLVNPQAVRQIGRDDLWYEPLVYDNPLYDLSASVRLASALWIRLRRRYFGSERLMTGKVFSTESTAFKIQVRLLERFVATIDSMDAVPLVVVFPDRISIESDAAGGSTVYEPLVRTLRRDGVAMLDLIDAFRQRPGPDLEVLFMPGGHYSPIGNSLVADAIGGALLELRSDADGHGKQDRLED